MINKWKINKKNLIVYFVLFAIAFFITTCSNVYFEKGFISVDVSVWVNVTKKIAQGKVIYRDIFDHKGPMLYLFYSIACIVPNQVGIWIFDLVCNCICVFMIYFMAKIIVNDKWKIFTIISICVLFMMNLCTENPGVESISLALTMISFYLGSKFFNDKKSLNLKVAFFIALCFSTVILIRPNLVLFWVIFYTYVAIELLKEREIKRLLKIIGISFLGVSVTFIPTILYFVKNNALDDFIDVYIMLNLKYQDTRDMSIITMIRAIFIATDYIIPIIALIYPILVIIKNKMNSAERKLAVFSFIYFVLEIYIIALPCKPYTHYILSMVPTFIVPLSILFKYVGHKKIKIVFLCVFAWFCVFEYCNIQIHKIKDYHYLKDFQAYLNENITDESGDSSVLVIGNKTMMYLMIDKYYDGKYFYQLPIADMDEKIADEILEDIHENLPKYIINTRFYLSEPDENLTYYERSIKSLLNKEYVLVNEYIYERVTR